MDQPRRVPAPVARPSEVVPDRERLDVYRVAVEFQALAASIGSARRLGALRDQLDRASVSIALNVAEGSGRFSPADKAHFYRIARGSAMECVAALTLLEVRSLVSPDLLRRARALLLRIIAMLTRLVASMQGLWVPGAPVRCRDRARVRGRGRASCTSVADLALGPR